MLRSQYLPARRGPFLVALVLCAVAFTACGGYDHDHYPYPSPYDYPYPISGSTPPAPLAVAETDSNDTIATADFMPLNRAAQGSVAAAGDVDVWSFDATSGEVIRIDLQAARVDQTGWDGACNVPRLTLVDQDGTTKLLEHDFSGVFSFGWKDGRHDLDFPAFRIPASGRYFVSVTQDNQAAAGGEYALWVRASTFTALTGEAEGVGVVGVNDTTATAQALADPGSSGRTVFGWHVDGESDVYSFVVGTPSLLSFEVLSYRNGVYEADDDYFDPLLNLISSDGVTLLASNDDAYFRDSALSYQITTPGTYFVQVVESAASAGDARYFLTYDRTGVGGLLESEPNDTAVQADALSYGQIVSGNASALDVDFFRFTGTAGDAVRVWFFELENRQDAVADVTVEVLLADGVTVLASDVDDGPGDLHVLRTILQTNGTHYLRVTGLAAATNYTVQLLRVRSARRETEPNDTVATGAPLDSAGRAAGVVDPAGDVDVFRFSAQAGELVTVSVYADQAAFPGSDGFRFLSGHGSTLHPALTVFDPAAAAVGSSSYTPPFLCTTTESVTDGLPVVTLTFIAPTSGTYAAEIRDELGVGGPTATYQIERK